MSHGPSAAEPNDQAYARRPRLVATDLDGTFLSPDGTISARNAAAVRAAKAAGITVVFATGRPPRWLDVIADLTGDTPVVASNGALLWDLAAGRAVASKPIDPEVALPALLAWRAEVPELVFALEEGIRFGHEPGYRIPGHLDVPRVDPRFRQAPLEQLWERPVVKILVQHPSLRSEELARSAAPFLQGRLTLTHSVWRPLPGLLELSAPGVTKAGTLAELASSLGVRPQEVAAFGDMPNDREMLEWSGLPHVMSQAHSSLADLDARRIGSNADSAVGRTLDQWL